MLECRLALNLNNTGVTTSLLAQYSRDDYDGDAQARYWKSKGVSEVYWFGYVSNIRLFVRFYQLYSFLKENDFDFVITPHVGLDISIGLCKFLLKFKHVIAFHATTYKSELNLAKYLMWKVVANAADRYYFISKKVQTNMNSLLSLDSTKGKVIYNSISTQDKDLPKCLNLRTELGLSKDCKIILGVGRITAIKGFDIAIDVLCNYLLNNDIVYVIMGDPTGDVHHIDELYERIKKLELEHKVFRIGFNENVIDIMKQVDLLLHLSRQEGFGLVLLDAITAGIPIVASNVGGIPEVLKNTSYKVFDVSSHLDILNEVDYYLNIDANKKSEIVDAAKRILPYFSDERRAKEIYELLIGSVPVLT
jgi:glycosyltransferase involved in cell wall biosynthesis